MERSTGGTGLWNPQEMWVLGQERLQNRFCCRDRDEPESLDLENWRLAYWDKLGKEKLEEKIYVIY